MSGNAALKAARELRDLIAPVAGELLGVPHGQLEFADGRVALRSDPGRFLSLAEVATAAEERGIVPQHLGTFIAEGGEFDPRTGRGKTFPDYTYGCHACEVEVDVETGVVRVLRYVACHDVGRAINPLRVEGQIQGGAVQGIGYALTEEVLIDEGVPRSSLFADYLIPTSMDVPDVRPLVLELGPGKGPFGARGIGEPPIAPAPPAPPRRCGHRQRRGRRARGSDHPPADQSRTGPPGPIRSRLSRRRPVLGMPRDGGFPLPAQASLPEEHD